MKFHTSLTNYHDGEKVLEFLHAKDKLLNRIHYDDTANIFIKDFPTAKLKEGIGASEDTGYNIRFTDRRDSHLEWMCCCLFYMSILDKLSPDRPILSVYVIAIDGL